MSEEIGDRAYAEARRLYAGGAFGLFSVEQALESWRGHARRARRRWLELKRQHTEEERANNTWHNMVCYEAYVRGLEDIIAERAAGRVS